MSLLDWLISCLQISWDITPTEPQYLMVEDFMRYYTRIAISFGCRYHEILHKNWCMVADFMNQNCYIFLLQISWDITPVTNLQLVCPFCLFVFLSHCFFIEIFKTTESQQNLMVKDFMRYNTSYKYFVCVVCVLSICNLTKNWVPNNDNQWWWCRRWKLWCRSVSFIRRPAGWSEKLTNVPIGSFRSAGGPLHSRA